MSDLPLARQRFLDTLAVVTREGQHLAFSRSRLYQHEIDTAWVNNLQNTPELAETLEAFVSRFGRMQDTIAGKLLPRWLLSQAETPGSLIEVLNRAEKLSVLDDTQRWLEARSLRNRLVHEYMNDAEQFADDLNLAREYSEILFQCTQRIRDFAIQRMHFSEHELPEHISISMDEAL